MSEASSSPKRPRLDFDDSSNKDDLYDKFNKNRDPDESSNVSQSKSKKRAEIDEDDGKDDDGKSKSLTRETARREHTLVMRLANKEQELQECMNQIQEMKQAQTQNTAQLHSMLLDPAINLVFQRMATEMDEHKEKLKQKQNELSAWKFTPDSQTGMRLMAKCRMLLQENGDLGKMISSGRTARLEGEIALHKALVTEMKKNQKELDEFVGELEEDVEGMQGMIFMLQEQLKEAREQITRLQQENEQLRTLRMPPDPEPGGETCGSQYNDQSGRSTPEQHDELDWTPNAPRDPHSINTVPHPLVGSSSSPTLPASSIVPPALSVGNARSINATSVSHQFSVTQSSEEDFNTSRGFASKMTPDSGMQTQEEKEVSMDTTNFVESSGAQQQYPTSVNLSDRTSGPEVANSSISLSKHSGIKDDMVRSPIANKSKDSINIKRTSNINTNNSTNVIEKSQPDEDSSTLAQGTPMSSPDSSSRLNQKPSGGHPSPQPTQVCDVNVGHTTSTPAICTYNGRTAKCVGVKGADDSSEMRTEGQHVARTNHSDDKESKDMSADISSSAVDVTSSEDSKISLQSGLDLATTALGVEIPDEGALSTLVNGTTELQGQGL